jgi:hypothetical protein
MTLSPLLTPPPYRNDRYSVEAGGFRSHFVAG